MASETTHVRVYDEDVDRIDELAERGEKYADVVRSLLDEHEESERKAPLANEN